MFIRSFSVFGFDGPGTESVTGSVPRPIALEKRINLATINCGDLRGGNKRFDEDKSVAMVYVFRGGLRGCRFQVGARTNRWDMGKQEEVRKEW